MTDRIISVDDVYVCDRNWRLDISRILTFYSDLEVKFHGFV